MKLKHIHNPSKNCICNKVLGTNLSLLYALSLVQPEEFQKCFRWKQWKHVQYMYYHALSEQLRVKLTQ